VALAAAACWRPVGPGVSEPVNVAPPGAPSVRFVYLGVGGWIIERGPDQVLTAPLFSNPSLVRTGLWRVRSDTAVVNRWMDAHDVSRAVAILVGHGHYDHLMDVPQVARRHAPRARILANRTSKNLLGTWSGVTDRVEVIDELAGDADTEGSWIRLGDAVRVMALRSHHAPHFAGYTLYAGTREEPATVEPVTADEWLEGRTFAFLVDFLEGPDSVVFRVYYADAVAQAPAGFAPESLIAERAVDVAILVPATFDQVDWHPEAFIENLGARWVLLGHWENFFVPPADSSRSIFVTDQRYFESRLERVHPGGWWRPEIGTVFRFPVG
jgi:hypothetical protein